MFKNVVKLVTSPLAFRFNTFSHNCLKRNKKSETEKFIRRLQQKKPLRIYFVLLAPYLRVGIYL